jgi:sulfur-carrier protein
MEVTLKYFAWVRERVGASEERVTLPAEVATVGDVIEWLKQRGEGYAAAFERDGLVCAAVNHEHARRDASLEGAREIAFFPPVTGG